MQTSIIEGAVVVRIELDRLIEILDGALMLPKGSVGVGAVKEGGSKLRIELDGPIEILNGALILANGLVDTASVIERMGVIRVELDGPIEILDGTVVLPQAKISTGAVVVGIGQDSGPIMPSLDDRCAAANLLVRRHAAFSVAPLPLLQGLSESRRGECCPQRHGRDGNGDQPNHSSSPVPVFKLAPGGPSRPGGFHGMICSMGA